MNIITVTAAHGMELQRKTGHTYAAPCPLHDERTPSFVVDTKANRFFCFGCGQAGDAHELRRQLQAGAK